MVFQSYELEQRRKIRDRNQNRNEMETGKGVVGDGGGGASRSTVGCTSLFYSYLTPFAGHFVCKQTNELKQTVPRTSVINLS